MMSGRIFCLHFVQTGIVSKEYGNLFSDLFDRRHTEDYDDFTNFNIETVLNLLSTGRDFIKEITEFIR